MKLSNNQWYIISSIFISGVAIELIFQYILDKKDQTSINFISLCGTFVSLIGLFITYIQVISLKQATEKTKLEIDNTLNRVNQILSISDLSKANKIIQEIQTSNLQNKLELSLMRMKDLKHMLIQIKGNHNDALDKFIDPNTYTQHLTDLGIDITNISTFMSNTKKEPNISKINSNLEELSTLLSEFESKLKSRKV